jgi:tRNA G10  N-methylase Trm11
MQEIYWYFKLFNNIKEEHEVEFAELELSSLFGKTGRVRNFTDIILNTPFSLFTNSTIPIQDLLAHELPYGNCQGFLAKTDNIVDISLLIQRLAYIREVFVVVPEENLNVVEKIYPLGKKDKNMQCFISKGHTLIRLITNQYFFEKSEYISKLSRNEREVDNNVNSLFDFLTKKIYRIPSSATMQVGKRLEDYFTIREEPSLYLTHYMHPYKGKFHPKMVRALLNCVYPERTGLVMDNFAGCGTLLVEATWMGLNSIGVELNPLSAMMSNVKCSSLSLVPQELKKAINSYLTELERAFRSYTEETTGSMLLVTPEYDKELINKVKNTIPKKVMASFKEQQTVDEVLIAQQLLQKITNNYFREFLLLGISGTISDLSRRKSGDFIDVLKDRLFNLYLRIYIFHRLNEVLEIKLGNSETFVADNRDMKIVQASSIDAIVNSPPYSAALDYIKNDLPQLTILKLADIPSLEEGMIGNPNLKVYSPSELTRKLTSPDSLFQKLSKETQTVIFDLINCGREKEAARVFKFFEDISETLSEMLRVMKQNAKCAIIIGNNHYKVGEEKYDEVKNDEVIKQLAILLGFKEERTITRVLEKTSAGMIRYESILILSKVSI